MLSKVDKRVAALAAKLSGDKLDIVVLHANELIAEGVTPGRALADALEKFNLI